MGTYRVVRGEFVLCYEGARRVGSKPDGGSVWFEPDDPKKLRSLGGRSAKRNAGGCAQVRLEGIDALELQFGKTHQNLAWARAARDRLVETLLGFACVEFSGADGQTVRSCDPPGLRGHLLTKSVDPHGRPIAFVYAGDPAEADGARVELGVARMKRSANARLLAAGLVYPAFYSGLEVPLRAALAASASAARAGYAGLLTDDLTRRGANATGVPDLQDVTLWPKLFRRLVTYYEDGKTDPYSFVSWLTEAPADRDDALTVLSTGKDLRLSRVVKVYRNKVSLMHDPEDLVVVPR